jgi:vitamin B12 transporter
MEGIMSKWAYKAIIFSIVCGLLAVPNVSLAEVRGENTGTYTLGEIVVTGEREGVETVGTVRDITAEDIKNKRARTLNEALELLPGVSIRIGAEGVPRVDVRGFRTRHVLLLLDGIPLNSTFDGQFDPSLIPVENIARIKVSYGDSSVLYGDGGLGGVINIITKTGKKGVHGSASGEIGEGDRRLGQLSLSGAQDKVNFFLSGSLFQRDGFRLSNDFKPASEEGGGLRENSDQKRGNFFGNVGYAPNDKWLIGLVFNYLKGEYGIPPSTINDNNDVFANKPKYERVDDLEGYSAQLSTSYDLPGPIDVRGWVLFNQQDEERNRYDNSNYNSMDDTSIKGTGTEESRTTITGAAFQSKYDLHSAGALTLGLSGRQEEWHSDGRVRDVEVKKKVYQFRDFTNDNDVDIYSASLEYEVSPVKNVGVVLGYGHSWFKKGDGGNDDAGTFLLGAHYDILPETRIRGSIARKIRFPSLRNLYEESGGNPDLTTETSYNYELGVEQRLPGNTRLALTGFLSDVKDYIEKVPVPSGDDMFMNNDKYRFQGFELTAETRVVANLLLRAGYTFMDTEDRSPGTEKEELQYRPTHKLTLEGRYDFFFGLSAYMNLIYYADQYYYSRTTPLQKAKLNNYAVVNVKLDQAFFAGRLHAYLGADNLFDKSYEESYAYPQAGRTVYGGIEYRF